jgi:putative ABC transport system permease protein
VQERLAFGFLSFFARTDRDPATLMPAVRSLVNRVDFSRPGIDVMLPMEQLVASSLTWQRFYAILLGTFAAIAAILGAIGSTACSLRGRPTHAGNRHPHGARPERGAVLEMVLRHGIALMDPRHRARARRRGGLARYLSGMLFDLTPLDPATYVAVGILFAAVALVASYLPARRATLIDPMVALRHD